MILLVNNTAFIEGQGHWTTGVFAEMKFNKPHHLVCVLVI
jgi:hypothetical protein